MSHSRPKQDNEHSEKSMRPTKNKQNIKQPSSSREEIKAETRPDEQPSADKGKGKEKASNKPTDESSDTEIISIKKTSVSKSKSIQRRHSSKRKDQSLLASKQSRHPKKSSIIAAFDHNPQFKRFDPKHVFISLLAEQVKNEFDKIYFKFGFEKVYKLSSQVLLQRIHDDIIHTLNDTNLSENQNDIIQGLMKKTIKQGYLPAICNKLIGEVNKNKTVSLSYFNKKSATGLCAIYVKALRLDEMIDQDSSCYTLYYGKPTNRMKRVQQSFYQFLVKAASPSQLAGLKNELSDKQVASLNTLRTTHGFFSGNNPKNTGRYKKYVKHIHSRDAELKNKKNHF